MANDFSSDTHCKLLLRLESGALATDSKGTNSFSNVGVAEDTSDYKEGSCCALYDDAASDRIYAADAQLDSGFPLKGGESNKTFSAAFWVKVDDFDHQQYIWVKSGGAGNLTADVRIGTDGKVNLRIYTDGTASTTVTHATALSTGIWYHIGVTYDGNDDNAYRIRIWDDNASAILGSDLTGIHSSIAIQTGSFYVGYPSTTSTINGRLDEFIWFDDILTVSEIDQIRAGTYGGAVDITVYPDTLALALTQEIPTIAWDSSVIPTTLALALAQQTPTVLFPLQTILPATLELALTQHAPTVGSFCTVTPDTLALAVTLQTSSLAVSSTALPDCFLLAIDLPPPSIFHDITIIPDTFALALTQHAPAVQKENDFSNDPNCVALWNMEDGELTTDSKGSNDLTNSGVNVSTSDFKQGRASGEFVRPEGDSLTISDSNQDSGFPLKSTESNKTFSFAIWFKSDDITDSQYLINEAQSGKYSFILYTSSSKIVLAISSDGTTWGFNATHDSILSSGVWYHVVVTYDNSDYSYRIRIHDATSVIGTDKTGTAIDINISDAGFYLGWPSLSLTLGGHMDEVVVFSDVLTVAEIDAIWSKAYSIANILPDTFALALTQETPIVGSFQVVEPATFQLALTQETSSLQIEVINYPATFQLALTLEVPTIALPIQIILPDTFALALTLQTPIVTAGNIITPDVFALALTQETVISQILQTILPDSLALVLALQTPSIAAGQVLITPDALILKAALLTSTAILRYVEMPPAMLELLIDPYKGGAWLWLAEIEVPGYDIIRIARNTEDVIYAGLTFEKSNFDVGRYGLSGEGSIPQVILRVAQDSDHVLEDIVNETEGAGDGNVKLIRTHEDFLESAVTSLEAIFDILTSESDTEWITLILGIPNPLLKKIPIRIYSSKICPYAVPTLFKGPECQYVGGDTYCTGKYDDCLTKGNTNHWGSELGLDPNTARI